MFLNVLISLLLLIYYVNSVCPNNCSGHGTCKNSVCVCYENVGLDQSESFSGFDCSLRRCFYGNPFGAVHSKLVSSGGLTSYNPDYRELYEMSTVNREMSEERHVVKLDKVVNTGVNTLWSVTGLETFIDVLPLTGGILSCRYYKDKSDTPESSPNTINVISYTDKFQYVLFEKGVDQIGNTPESPDGVKNDRTVYTKVECDDIISTRNDLSQLIPITVKVKTTRQLEPTTVTVDNYVPILKDMGLLVENKAENKYENKNFRLACYSTTTQAPTVTTETPVTIYNKVTASYKSDSVLTFTFDIDNTPKDAGDYVCVCLMDSDGAIDIEDAEIYSNIRKEEDNSYKIGKYAAVADADKAYSFYELNHVVIVNNVIAKDTVITIADAKDTNGKRYLNQGRAVYVTILTNGIFSEELVVMADSNKIGEIKTAGGVVMPYIRTYPMNPLTELPKTVIEKQTSGTLYKAYYFAENLLYSLKKEGGILQCSYTKTDPRERILTEESVEIDVKGIVKDVKNNEIIYSYIEYNGDVNKDLSTGTLSCLSIKSIRNDLTTYHSLTKLTVTTLRTRQLAEIDFLWTGYGEMIKDLDFFKAENDKKNLACFKVGGVNEINEYAVKTVNTDSTDVKFTIDESIIKDSGDYWCLTAMRYDGSDVLLENSDMKDKIIKDGSKYYLGDFIPPKDTIEFQEKSDGRTAIVLDEKSSITLADPKKVTLTLTKEIPKELEIYFVVKQTFKLKLVKTDSPLDELIITVELTNVDETKKVITFTTDNDYSSYTALSVLYINIIEPTEPTNPPKIPTVVNLDSSTNLYEINNFLLDKIKYLPNIGGSLKCNINKQAGIIDVKGVKIEAGEVTSGYFLFEESLNNGRLLLELNEITNCEILSFRKDVSLYNPLNITSLNYDNRNLLWRGYGTIFKNINFSYKDKEMACYNPEKKLFIFYNVSISNVKQFGDIYDLKITFISASKPSENDVCYLLSDGSGNSISIEESELWSLVRKEDDGKYYFGKNKVNTKSGKSEEVKQEDGSIDISFSKEAIVGDSSSDDLNKMNIFKLNEETPSLGLPPSYIGSEIKKMMYPGTTITFSFSIPGRIIPPQSSQILKIEKESDSNKERFKLLLSNQIFIPTIDITDPRLRSLQAKKVVSTDLSLTLAWKTEGSTHIPLECSGQGSCDRTSGLCNCYDGFSGSACQRLDCPNNCNGNGRCVPLSELLSNSDLENYIGYGNKHESKYDADNAEISSVSFDNQVFGCLCDKRHRGYDCSLIECPSGEDPEKATNQKNIDDEKRDCSGRGICNYNTGVCECFDGFSGEGCQTQTQMM